MSLGYIEIENIRIRNNPYFNEIKIEEQLNLETKIEEFLSLNIRIHK